MKKRSLNTFKISLLGALLCLSSLTTLAQELTPDEIRAQRDGHGDFKPEDFKPHMVDHPFAGCPLNSSCTQELGAQREKFTQFLKRSEAESTARFNRFIKDNPINVPIFIKGTAQAQYNDKNFIIWDSPCAGHAQVGQNIYLAEAMIKNMKELQSFPHAQTGLILVENEGRIESYQVPRDHTPRYAKGQALVFLHEEGGRYYNLSYHLDGTIKNEKTRSGILGPEAIQCSALLEVHYQSLSLDSKAPFGHYICRSLYNTQNKKRQNTLIAWSCK